MGIGILYRYSYFNITPNNFNFIPMLKKLAQNYRAPTILKGVLLSVLILFIWVVLTLSLTFSR